MRRLPKPIQEVGYFFDCQFTTGHFIDHHGLSAHVAQLRCQLSEVLRVDCINVIHARLSLYTFLVYNQTCFASFYEGEVTLNLSQSNLTLPWLQTLAHDEIVFNLQWRAGSALISMFLATCLKSLDILANFAAPAPSITRDKAEQWRYEALDTEEDMITV